MKIAINEDQPLDNVVAELERLGLNQKYKTDIEPKSIKVTKDGYYIFCIPIFEFVSDAVEITIAELKEMK